MVGRISVVIPCRNDGDGLDRCLRALHDQTFPADAFEVLVVDGRSTDDTGRIALAHGARLLTDPGDGPGAARNVGIRHARGDVIAFTDADCYPDSGWLAAIARSLATNADAAGVAGSMRMPRDTLLGRLEDDDAQANYRGYITSNVAYRRDALLRVGGFDEALQCCEDYDLAWRLLDAGERIVHDDGPSVIHDCPELRAGVHTYLAKQFWYARRDWPSHLRAIGRARAAPHATPGSRAAVMGARHALEAAAWTLLVAGGLAAGAPRVAVAGIVGLLARAAAPSWRTATRAGDARAALPMTLLSAAKQLARGAGAIVGLVAFARAAERRAVARPPRTMERDLTRGGQTGGRTPLADAIAGAQSPRAAA